MTRPIGLIFFSASLLIIFGAGLGCAEHTQPTPEREPSDPDLAEIVQLSAEAMSRNGIRLAKVTEHVLGEAISAPAEVTLNPDRIAHVAPLVAGQLRKVKVSIGDHVESGQILAVLRSVQLGQARAEFRRATAMLAAAQTNFARQRRLRIEGISSERSFLEAQLRQAQAEAELDAARAQLLVFGLSGGGGPDMPITAPIAGTIVNRHATRGENVGPEDNLFVIADTAKVWVVGRVYERDMPRVRMGASAELALQAQPEKVWEGVVRFVAPVVDEETRTLSVRIELDNEHGLLRPGLFGRLRIAVGDAQPVLTVSQDAVQTLRGEPVVFVPAGGGDRFRPQAVKVGRRNEGLVEIREGLTLGSPVVVAGAFLLKSQLLSGEFGEEE